MLKRHHIRGIRQTIFSGMVVFLIASVMFVGLRPSIFTKAAEIVSIPIVGDEPVFRLPSIEDATKKMDIEIKEKKLSGTTYIARPKGLPVYKVTKVIDGNTIDLDVKTRIRLIGIKAPEIDEEMGLETFEYLKKTVEGKEVYLQIDSKNPEDFLERMRGIIYLDRKNINIEMLRYGFAHVYPTTPSIVGYSDWEIFEKEAREAKRGLWAGEKPEVPENSIVTP